ncbi:hypothetical protein GCM10009416_18110 [Craurococcus roseus]|uniref:Uncharacterized protein n=1 Tax=Craurococcus roseus TaxID=77585 RepID=A0ABN1F2L3_9PROT
MTGRRFRSAAERRAEDNLRALVAEARRTDPFGAASWDALAWPLPNKSAFQNLPWRALR